MGTIRIREEKDPIIIRKDTTFPIVLHTSLSKPLSGIDRIDMVWSRVDKPLQMKYLDPDHYGLRFSEQPLSFKLGELSFLIKYSEGQYLLYFVEHEERITDIDAIGVVVTVNHVASSWEEVSDGYHTFGELYDHRFGLFLNLMKVDDDEYDGWFGCWKSKKNADGSSWDGWFVAGMFIEGKEISYHLPIKYWDKCPGDILEIGKWDGHTSLDVVERLLKVFV